MEIISWPNSSNACGWAVYQTNDISELKGEVGAP